MSVTVRCEKYSINSKNSKKAHKSSNHCYPKPKPCPRQRLICCPTPVCPIWPPVCPPVCPPICPPVCPPICPPVCPPCRPVCPPCIPVCPPCRPVCPPCRPVCSPCPTVKIVPCQSALVRYSRVQGGYIWSGIGSVPCIPQQPCPVMYYCS